MTLGSNIQKIKNASGAYSMDYADGVVYSVPNQAMPGWSSFHLNFFVAIVWCEIDLEDVHVKITWGGENNFSAAAVSKEDDMVIGSTSKFKESDFTDMKKLGDELSIPEKEMREIIEKGNELYRDFYPEQ